jgi:DNA-dependent metalloprotease WSS1
MAPPTGYSAAFRLLTRRVRLAHCKQMNHSKAFWAVRNNYAEQMRTLWTRGYTGEGLWGRGTLLTTGKFEANTVAPGDPLPEHLCGGTYRSRRRKRKVKDQLTYQQRKERRILKKFGANGVALGQDEEIKAELEKGKRTQSKPRVAQSKRGRELRAAAALARFDKQKKSDEEMKKEEELVKAEDETASEDEFETSSETEDEASGATDINGKRLVDGKGNRLIKVCEDENPEDDDAQQELRELQTSTADTRSASGTASSPSSKVKSTAVKLEEDSDDNVRNGLRGLQSPAEVAKPLTPKPAAGSKQGRIKLEPDDLPVVAKEINFSEDKVGRSGAGEAAAEAAEHSSAGRAGTGFCPMCSFENGPVSLTCAVCSHVLDGTKDPKVWRCDDLSCKDSQYLNAGDAGVCGLCGRRKPA